MNKKIKLMRNYSAYIFEALSLGFWVFAQEMYEAWMPNQASKDGFTAFSGANSQNLRRSLIVLNSYIHPSKE